MILPINDKGYIFIDDIDKLNEKELNEMLNEMENGIVTYRKIGIDD